MCLRALILLIAIVPLSRGEWRDPSGGQYHVQTDEGPERYFRYQTNSGQYRKEKRLADGTVIGTYAWIDGAGMLRMQDYLADAAGYRILKSKDMYVGIDRPIAEAVKMAKKSYTAATPTPTVPYPSIRYTPAVRILPNGLSLSAENDRQSTTPIATQIYASTTTPRPPATADAINRTTYSAPASATFLSTTPAPPPPLVDTNEIGPYYGSEPQYEHYDGAQFEPFVNPYLHRNGPTYPLDKHGQTFDPRVDDGAAVTNDGFRYYIPRAYHEEASDAATSAKTGSFGYVDPFGIRRVVYYQATRDGGFKHRKNNRYVGFGAAPYDPPAF